MKKPLIHHRLSGDPNKITDNYQFFLKKMVFPYPFNKNISKFAIATMILTFLMSFKNRQLT